MSPIPLIIILSIWANSGKHANADKIQRRPEEGPYKPLFVNWISKNESVDYLESYTFERDTKYLCPGPKYYNPYVDYDDPSDKYKYCLFENTEGKFNCDEEVEPFIVTAQPEERCGPENDKKGKIYEFVFHICDNYTNKMLTIYKFCSYFNDDTDEYELLHTWHKISTPIVASSEEVAEFCQYTSDTYSTEGYGIFGRIFEDISSHYLMQQEIGENSMSPQLMVSPDDFFFGNWKKATYHYANLTLTTPKIYDLTRTVDECIRDLAKQMNAEFEIYLKVWHELHNNNIIWLKIVYHERRKTGATIVVSQNNSLSGLCGTEVSCIFFPRGVECCDISMEHMNKFGINLQVEGYLIDDTKEVYS